MKWKTSVDPEPLPEKISTDSKISAIGSCFAEHLSNFLTSRKFDLTSNPSGIIYNPHSIAELLHDLCDKNPIDEKELFLHRGLWHHFQFHGKFSNRDKNAALQKMNQSLQMAADQLITSDFLILTLGTSFVFREKPGGSLVSNCHKMPGEEFNREWLSPSKIHKDLSAALTRLLKIRPELKIIFTVSPVRHIRDGMVANNRSKSALHLAVHYLQASMPDSVFYFPSYEIILDELRDYRFYKEDLIHPSDQAIQYVLSKFANAALSDEAKVFCSRMEGVLRAMDHRLLQPGTSDHMAFIKMQLKNIEDLHKSYPRCNFQREFNHFQNQLKEHFDIGGDGGESV
nr:GSCFA domain-containing protein [Saprospiraceae bacterium]